MGGFQRIPIGSGLDSGQSSEAEGNCRIGKGAGEGTGTAAESGEFIRNNWKMLYY